MIEVPDDNVFAVNRLGLEGDPLPYSFSWDEFGGLFRLDLVGLRARDVIDLLSPDSTVLVFAVEHMVYEPEKKRSYDLAELAVAAGIEHDAFDVGWTDPRPSAGRKGAIVASPAALARLLDDLPHYDLKATDVPARPPAADVDELVLAAQAPDWPDAPFLLNAAASTFYLDVHDDLYVLLEARGPELLQAAAARALAGFTGEQLRQRGRRVAVTEPPSSLIADLVRRAPGWTLASESVARDGDSLRMGFTARAWTLAEPMPRRADAVVVYDSSAGGWTLER